MMLPLLRALSQKLVRSPRSLPFPQFILSSSSSSSSSSSLSSFPSPLSLSIFCRETGFTLKSAPFRRLFASIPLSSAAAAAAGDGLPIDVESLLGMASGAAESGHYERALRAYIRILRIDAAHVDALFGAAVCAHNLGRLEDAIQYYGEAAKRYKRQQLVESSPSSTSSSAESNPSISTELSGKNEPRLHLPAMCGAADCMAALGHFEDAIKQYSRVLKADPSYVPAYGGRADAWLSWGHSGDSRGEAAQQQATRDLEALLAVEP